MLHYAKFLKDQEVLNKFLEFTFCIEVVVRCLQDHVKEILHFNGLILVNILDYYYKHLPIAKVHLKWQIGHFSYDLSS